MEQNNNSEINIKPTKINQIDGVGVTDGDKILFKNSHDKLDGIYKIKNIKEKVMTEKKSKNTDSKTKSVKSAVKSAKSKTSKKNTKPDITITRVFSVADLVTECISSVETTINKYQDSKDMYFLNEERKKIYTAISKQLATLI